MSVTFGLPILVRFLIYTPNSLLFTPIFSSVVHYAGNIRGWASVDFLWYVAKESANTIHKWRGWGVMQATKNLTRVCAPKLFWCAIYFAKLRPNPRSHSGFRSCRGLGRRATWIMCDYKLTIVISIWPLTHTHICESVSLRFFVMSKLKSFYHPSTTQIQVYR